MISVCMATYNAERYISSQIRSILMQLGSDDELIISDDQSNDNTIPIILSFKDSRIKLYNHHNNVGLINENLFEYSRNHYRCTKNFESALNKVRGDYIFLCDQDDVWYENKIEVMLKYLKQGYSVVQSNYSLIDTNSNVYVERYFDCSPLKANLIKLLIKQPFHGCCMAFEKKILDLALPFPNNLIMHDNWIGFVNVIFGGQYVFINEPLVYYRRHPFNVSKGKSPNPMWFKFYYRIKFIVQLFRRFIWKFNK